MILPQGNVGTTRGVWTGYKSAPLGKKPVVVISFSCPRCGVLGKVDPAAVHVSGLVMEIVSCACGWGETGVVLEKWKPIAS